MRKYTIGLCLVVIAMLAGAVGSQLAAGKPAGKKGAASKARKMVFKRVTEPNEKAFTVLVPEGWKVKGGVFRLDPTASGGPGNAVAAKVDMTLQADDEGTIQIRFLPDYVYFDMSNSPAGQMGLFPVGSIYQGMPVYPKMNAASFVRNLVYPYVHGNGRQLQGIVDNRALPKLAEAFRARVLSWGLGLDFRYDATLATYHTTVGGKEVQEQVLTVVEDWGALGAGTWGNKATILVRAPAHRIKELAPVFATIVASVEMSQSWVTGELRGQQERGRIAIETQKKVLEIGRQIAQHHADTNADINHEMFLNLTGQEDYVNPHTKKVERGTNAWNRRWESGDGTVIYTDDVTYNPNRDKTLKRDDFKRSKAKKRK